MTYLSDPRRHHLELVRDSPVDIEPEYVRTVHVEPARRPPQHGRLARWSYRYWAVGLTVAAQLMIAGAIALGGDPIIGAAAAVIMLLCGLALITAEVATMRAVANTLAPDQARASQVSQERAGQ